jgi:hypothetical protein
MARLALPVPSHPTTFSSNFGRIWPDRRGRATADNGTLAGLDVSARVSRGPRFRHRQPQPAVVARVARVSRQALYRPLTVRSAGAGPDRGRPSDQRIADVASASPDHGTRTGAALASRELGRPVNRERARWVLREHKLLQAIIRGSVSIRGLLGRERPALDRSNKPTSQSQRSAG